MHNDYITRTVHSLSHAETFSEALKAINEGVTRALPSKRQYKQGIVLSLRWENDNLDRKDIDELLRLFNTKYGIKTDSFLLPSAPIAEVALAIQAKIRTMLSIYDSPDTLFVFVYEGHSNAYYDIPNACVSIMGSMREPTVSLPWGFVETALAFTDGDVVFILDSPFPSRAAMICEDIEYLAVSAFGSPAARSINVSLKRRLIDLLGQVDAEITISQIHAKLAAHANSPGSQLGLIPVHFPAKNKPSITLRPIGACPRQRRGPRKAGDLSDGKVFVTVRIVSDTTSVPDIVEQCIQCLSKSIAGDVADIKIEGIFKFSPDSSLLLFTMPTAVWNMLRHDHSFDFVSVVQSYNLLCHRSTATTTHPLALASGNADLPYGGKG
ncbi:hypothetical protein AtubIFM56815_008573 [Aspergillus tubingensis]|uniref:Uncharacterized protein n=2 Tax=Aspergillus subgen. Circumdati TaxID=2720871 RepID=A0A100IL56_ASPNG|nr:hypothetical protein AKAW_05170 [Aspergillus niger]GLA58251.1 hypothetical protein AtubIFM54640_007397 [Aspergillus tubingensis]GLA84360.1 hypothetical protein AtubIFM56815_008573 [Aspergillus tubingensis]